MSQSSPPPSPAREGGWWSVFRRLSGSKKIESPAGVNLDAPKSCKDETGPPSKSNSLSSLTTEVEQPGKTSSLKSITTKVEGTRNVTWKPTVLVTLIPSRSDYKAARVFDDVWWKPDDYCLFQAKFEKDFHEFMKGKKMRLKSGTSSCRNASIRQFIEHEVRNI